MVKIIVLQKRKPGMSMDEFRDYYEKRHLKYVKEIGVDKFIYDYRRNYLHVDDNDFDLIVEFTFKTQEDYENFMAIAQVPETAEMLARDEMNFLDRTKVRVLSVHEESGPNM